MGFQYLLLLDTDRIKSYVFASPKLKEIRGASMLLEYLNIIESKETIFRYFGLSKDFEGEHDAFRILYLNGGSGKIEFKHKEDAMECGKRIEKLYRTWTKTASITWEVIEIDDTNDYFVHVSRGEYLIRQKKQSGKVLGQTNHLGMLRRCKHCGVEMVEEVEGKAVPMFLQEIKKEKERFPAICISCLTKRAFERKEKSYASIHALLEEKYKGYHFEWPQQLSVIGQAAANGDIGLLYFDGNSMNEVLKKIRDAISYQEFSAKLHHVINEALIHTVTKVFPPGTLPSLLNHDEEEESQQKQRVSVLPVEFILTAGDDIIAIVPSTKAMAFTKIFLQTFAEYSLCLQQVENGLTMSAGVAIAKASFPIKYLVPLAEQLLRSAKKKNYRLKYRGVMDWQRLSTLDYMVVSMSSNPELTDIRERQLKREKEGKEYHLTTRPYSLNEWEQMEQVVKRMKEPPSPFPMSKMKSFYHLHFLDDWESQYYFVKYFANLPEKQRENMRRIYEIFDQNLTHFHWFTEDERRYYSPLIDAFEIYRYIEEGEQSDNLSIGVGN